MSAGRKLYDEWSTYWPDSTDEPMATYFNDVPTYVISSSLENPAWNNTTVLPGDADAIADSGRASTAKAPCREVQRRSAGCWRKRLLDELRLLVHPIAVGKGQRLFEDTPTHKLELADSATLSSGVRNLTYPPGSEPLGTENGPAEPSGASPT